MIWLRLTQTFPFRIAEWASGAMMLGWGVVLAQPAATFEGPSYSELARWAPESVWAWLCTAVGTVRLLALTVNGAVRSTPAVRAVLAAVTGLFWLQIFLGMAAAGTVSTGLAIYPVLVTMEAWSCWVAAADARLYATGRRH